MNFDEINKRAKSGDATMMFELARRYFDGVGVATDRELAIYWYERAASSDHWFIKALVGGQYERGIRLAQSCDRAEELYLEAWSAGLVFGAYALGRLYSNFLGKCPGKRDLKKAKLYLVKAIRNGHMTSLMLLLSLSIRGKFGIAGRLIGTLVLILCSPYLAWTTGRKDAYRRWSGWRDFFDENGFAARRIMRSVL